MRMIGILTFLAVLAAHPAAAQQEVPFGAQEMIPGPWKFDNFPYFTVTPNDGFMFIGRAQYGQAADFLDRVSMARRFAIEGGLSPSGSRFVALIVDLPRLAPGWRLAADFRLERANRFGFYGLGNETEELDGAPDEPYGNRVRRTRALARVEVTRTLAGPVALAVAAGTGSTDWNSLPGNSRFADFASLVGGSIEENDSWARVAVVLDARDNAFEPNRGVLVEGGVFTGTGGDGYAGGYAIASGFANPAFGTVLAARLGGRSMSSDAPLTARFGIPAWEREVPMLGGPGSHRSLAVGRFAGHSALFGSLELRQVIIDAGDMAGVYGLLFLDAGRVFEGDAGVDAPSSRESFRLTTEDLKVGGGVGVAIRLLRANIFSTSVATGPDGVKVMVGSGWMF
jgi:hypothetical protein